MIIRLGTLEEFEAWVSRMDDEIESLKKALPDKVSSAMNYSVESLTDVEEYLLEQYFSPEALIEDFINYERFGRYVGEVLRRHTGNNWHIELEDEDFAFFGSPVLRAFNSTKDSPFRLITTCIHRQTGVFIRRIGENYIRNTKQRSG